ncbi:DUF4105 domain-containing protein [Flavobacterium sp. D11R37]|uniref:Lnb N-terminal periplasmic domain-containing protein n=1 Tax=Flavobacterium coralii TaxID=2838017 RepID=UPI001CA72DF6|nr:DUF4105 domain-containing protein [Flavobacterium coralii]MBY8962436.1 DUF4105 domain-containing protein [Flavobacterium coralii]
MRSTLFVLLLFTICFLPFTAKAQFELTDQAKVTLLTCGPGDELYSTFGHTAIRVADSGRGLDIVYNFGTFDFSTPNFYLKFVKGDLQYFVSVTSYREFLQEYEYYGRSVQEQELLLTQQQKQSIANELNSILLSDRRFYTYKFIDRNCTTMVADIIAANIEGKISDETSDKGKTNREIIYSYLDNHFYENLGINLIFGYKTDKISDKLFLPQELLEGITNTSINGKPLATQAALVNAAQPKVKSFTFWNSFYSYALSILLLMWLTRYKVIRLSYMAITGLIGLFFCTVGFYSFHDEISQNYNALLVNPLFLLLVIAIFAGKAKAVRTLCYILFACFAIYILFMLNKPHLLIVLPLLALNTVTLLRVLRINQRTKSV